MESFSKELRNLINAHSRESASNTPDHILSMYLERCLETFGIAVNRRDIHNGRIKQPDEVVPGVHPSLKAPLDLYGREAGVRLGASAKPIYDAIKIPWDGGREPKVPVEGHASDCEINLDWEWTPCNCEAG